MDHSQSPAKPLVPTNLTFAEKLRKDALSGFLVFLIALPLCLAIANASGFPPIAGVLTAVIGGLITPWISNSQLTIKGPAAGMIVIVLGAVLDFKTIVLEANPSLSEADVATAAYRMAIAVGVVAAVLQIVFGLLKAGVLGDFFPAAAVHGLLASIGIIIISKQLPIAVGQSNKGEPLELLREIPDKIMHLNPEVATIGFLSLMILFLWPLIKHPLIKKIPAQVIVIAVAIPLAWYFNFSQAHSYTVLWHDYAVDSKFLVNVPGDLTKAIVFPDFTALSHVAAWKWVVMFSLIGSLESMLSAKAVDILDPQRRKTDLNRDLLGVGVANLVSAGLGGLPMISEIVRSRANVDNGAQSKFANFFHGLFLLLAVAVAASLIRMIPLAALAGMLVYTGFRLAHPREFAHTYGIGREQLLIFVGTIIAVLATDLLVGIFIGIGIKLFVLFCLGVPALSLVWPKIDSEPLDDGTWLVRPHGSAVFCNWIMIRRYIDSEGLAKNKSVVVDLAETKMVDHTVMDKLFELGKEFDSAGLKLTVQGLNDHIALSLHPRAARWRLPSKRDVVASEFVNS